ncbi:MAG: hypothetical protein O7B99_07670, partial [Planctomycetota bacterium]|nr:hypothetical protein [Planctomycetota bacterium]
MLAASAVLVAGGASAQVTHGVTVGPTFSFSPVDISIDVGDTVLWTWSGSFFHNVESGDGGVGDGIFDSGAPVAGA